MVPSAVRARGGRVRWAQRCANLSVSMPKAFHEVRDPIHTFVRLEPGERAVVNSRAFQRLRDIHQLATTYLVYPGASHKRFEHSLGVMHVADQIFQVVTREDKLSDHVREVLPADADERKYWRRVLRLAALLHDVGHLPFSHAAEDELLPEAFGGHEAFTERHILEGETKNVIEELRPGIHADDVAKLAVGPKRRDDLTTWEAILAEIITGDVFGADRIDYLLRDSHHIGVAYGRFDSSRLVETLRILPDPASGEGEALGEPKLGIEEGGVQAAEALLLARYQMFSQVYFHPVRRIYDIHLKDFLVDWLEDGVFSPDLGAHLAITDAEVLTAMRHAATHDDAPGHAAARRLTGREHFRRFYTATPTELVANEEAGLAVFDAAAEKFGSTNVRHDAYDRVAAPSLFPVLTDDGDVVSSVDMSAVVRNVPPAVFDYVFIAPELADEARDWLRGDRAALVAPEAEEDESA